MLRSIDMITYRNGFRINGKPASMEQISVIYEGRREAALSVWEQYEKQKAKLRERLLTSEQYQLACRQIAKALGV